MGQTANSLPSCARKYARRLPRAVADLHADAFTTSVAEPDAVWKVLVGLPPRWRAALLLQTMGGVSVAEIARQ